MKSIGWVLAAVSLVVPLLAFGGSQAPVNLNSDASTEIGNIMRSSAAAGSKFIQYNESFNVSRYSTANFECDYMERTDSVTCSNSDGPQLSHEAALTIGNLMRESAAKGDKFIHYSEAFNVSKYIVGNLECDYMERDDSVFCTIQ